MQENKVIWLEGMFLQPQHFQQNMRYVENYVSAINRNNNAHHFGFSKLCLDTTLLSVGKVSIEFAEGFFQDGTPFNFPKKDEKPAVLTVTPDVSHSILYLAIPLQKHCAETGEATSNELYRYQVNYAEIMDSTAGNSHIAEVPLGRLKTQILTEKDNLEAFQCLAFARISEVKVDKRIEMDSKFIPTVIDIWAVEKLSDCINEFQLLLNHRGEMLASRLADAKQASNAETVDLMLLQIINRYEVVFNYLNHSSPLHPETVYLVLIKLAAEMSTFTNDKRRPLMPEVYIHDDLKQTFSSLININRKILNTVLQQNAISVQMQDQQHGLWFSELLPFEIADEYSYILTVYADLPMDKIKTVFASQVKIAPVEQIRTLISKQLAGIEIETIAVAPRQIPYHANFIYFSINSKNNLWAQLESSSGLAIHISKFLPGLQMELWEIKG